MLHGGFQSAAIETVQFFSLGYLRQSMNILAIAVLLFFVLGKLTEIGNTMQTLAQNPQAQAVVAADQALIAQMQKLETSFDALRKEISDFRAKLPK